MDKNTSTKESKCTNECKNGCNCDPLAHAKTERDVIALADAIIENGDKNRTSDTFWDKTEKVFLEALLLYIWHMKLEEDRVLSNADKLIDKVFVNIDDNSSSTESPLDMLFSDLEKEDPESLAVIRYKTFKLGAGKTQKAVIMDARAKLAEYSH